MAKAKSNKKKKQEEMDKQIREWQRNEIECYTGKKFEDQDVDTVFEICCVLMQLRDKYELGNFDKRDCADEINAMQPKVFELLAQYDLSEPTVNMHLV